MLQNVAIISCNNDEELGTKIGEAYEKVGKDGVVFMEQSDSNETYVDFVEGVQFDSAKLKSPHFALRTKTSVTAVLERPVWSLLYLRRYQTLEEYKTS